MQRSSYAQLPIIGRAHVELTAEAGARIRTWVYVVKDKKEQSLLGKNDGERLGIIKLNPQGATAEVVNRLAHIPKTEQLSMDAFEEDPQVSDAFISEFPKLFSNKTGKYKGDPIRIHVKQDAVPVNKRQGEYRCTTSTQQRARLNVCSRKT